MKLQRVLFWFGIGIVMLGMCSVSQPGYQPGLNSVSLPNLNEESTNQDMDLNPPIVADLAINFSSWLGGDSLDYGNAITADSAGNIYVAGRTFSSNTSLPLTNAYDSTFNGSEDGFIAKISPTPMYHVAWATYLGGAAAEDIKDIFVDATGNVYVTGDTTSTDFPVVGDGPDSSLNGTTDAFIAKFNPLGILIFSSYWGGSAVDNGRAIAANSTGHIFIAGRTYSTDFTLVSPLDSAMADAEVFVTIMNSTGDVEFSTFLGGSVHENVMDMEITDAGEIYLTGFTDSSDFPKVGAIDSTNTGGMSNQETYMLRISPSRVLTFSSFFGGNDVDLAYGIDVNSNGDWCISGRIVGTTGFTFKNAWDNSLSGGADGWVAKLNSTNNLQWSTLIGGSDLEDDFHCQIDELGNVYIAGTTDSTDYYTKFAYDSTPNTDSDIAVTKFSTTGIPIYSSYLGGNAFDECEHMCLVSPDQIYITGYTYSMNFPYVNFIDFPDSTDFFVTKMYFRPNPDSPVLQPITYDIDDNGLVALNWSTSTGATTYRVYRYPTKITAINASTTILKTVSTNWTTDLLTVNGTYYYAITAVNASGASDPSNSLSVLVLIPPIPRPILDDPTLGSHLNGSVSLNWNDITKATYYVLYRHPAPITTINGSIEYNTITTSSNYLDQLYTNGTYYYAIVASNGTHKSEPSLCKSVIIDIDNIAPSVTSPSNTSVEYGAGVHFEWIITDWTTNLSCYYLLIVDSVLNDSSGWTTGMVITTDLLILSLGGHNITLIVADAFGGITVDEVWITITNLAPSINGPTNFYINFGSLENEISWMVTDNSVVLPIYDLIIDDVPDPGHQNVAFEPGTAIVIGIDGYGLGPHNFTIVVDDGLGMIRQDDVIVTVTNLPPSITGSGFVSYLYGASGQHISWTIIDTTISSPTYSLYKDSVPIPSYQGLSWTSNVPIVYNLVGLDPGDYNYTILASDGVSAISQNVVIVSILNTPIIFTSPNDFSYVEGSSGNAIVWTLSDRTLKDPFYRVLFDGSQEILPLQSWSNNTNIRVNVDGYAPGTYNFTIIMSDGLGFQDQDTVILTVLVHPEPPPNDDTTPADDDDNSSDGGSKVPGFPLEFVMGFGMITLLIIIKKKKRDSIQH